jgi:hypothetical protein
MFLVLFFKKNKDDLSPMLRGFLLFQKRSKSVSSARHSPPRRIHQNRPISGKRRRILDECFLGGKPQTPRVGFAEI